MRPLKIVLAAPGPSRLPTGNRVTARRWAGILRSLGHSARIVRDWTGGADGLLVALHAHKSAASVERFRRAQPGAPVLVALTGTDVYGELRTSARARRALEAATRVVVLQPEALRELPARVRRKARVVRQSALPPTGRRASAAAFPVCVLSHLRRVKDPLRAARAARLLPASSRVRVLHAGAPLDQALARQARAEERANPRYRWLGAVSPRRARSLLSSSRVLVLSSRVEGGGNVVAEALAAGVPIISSRIPGVIGTLGRGYPGYFPFADTPALARLLLRAEADPVFYRRLESWCGRLRLLAAPERERRAWAALLRELPVGRGDQVRTRSPKRTRFLNSARR